MEDAGNTDPNVETPRLRRRMLHAFLVIVVIYLLTAYVIVPRFTGRYYRHHPWLDDNPRITQTGDGHPGDPLNVALVGTKEHIETIMKAAKWDAAAALGVISDIKIAEDTVLKRSDVNAPVSNLYLFGRKEDLAFEQPVGGNPRQRNHVRFWKADKLSDDGRPVWVGSASYDERVEFSDVTLQVTHRISPDLDKERDHLFADLKATGELADQFTLDGFHTELKGRNGGGDPWYTDGDLFVGVIKADLK